MVVDYLDYLFRSRHVCCYWGALGAVVTEGVYISSSLETFQTSAGAIVVLLHRRVCPLALLSGAYVSNLDIFPPVQSTNFPDSESMVHLGNVVLACIRMDPHIRAIYLFVDTQVQVSHSDSRHQCCNSARCMEHRHRRIRLGSRRHSSVLHLHCYRNGVACRWTTIPANSSLRRNCVSCRRVRMAAVPATARWCCQ